MAQDSPLYNLLNQINAAARGGLHLLAIAMAVALPDICVSLASEDGRSDATRYKKWCEENLSGQEFSFITGDDLYSMRCGVLHNGRFGDLKHNVSRVLFTPPNPQNNVFSNCQINDAYFYGVVEFCQNITNRVFHWHEANREGDNVKNNIGRLMQYYPDGIAPYVKGLMVIG